MMEGGEVWWDTGILPCVEVAILDLSDTEDCICSTELRFDRFWHVQVNVVVASWDSSSWNARSCP